MQIASRGARNKLCEYVHVLSCVIPFMIQDENPTKEFLL